MKVSKDALILKEPGMRNARRPVTRQYTWPESVKFVSGPPVDAERFSRFSLARKMKL
jgi:hypothetical protein